MPSVFRPTYHSPIYEPATYSNKKGIRVVRFRLPKSGQYVTGEVINGRAKVQQATYVARIRRNGKSVRVPLGIFDKDAAESRAAQLQLDADRGKDGEKIKRMADHADTKLLDHLEDYKASLEGNNCDGQYITEAYRLIKRIISACRFWTTDDLDAKPMNTYLAGILKRKKGNSYRTRNKALVVFGGFIHWMQEADRYDGDDPFKSIRKLPEQADPNKRERRALTDDEVNKIIAAAERGEPVRHISGAERSVIYKTALGSGLRAAELGKLEVHMLVLDGEFPYIDLPPAIAKTKREALQPLPQFAADALSEWTKGKPRDSRVFHLYSDGGHMRETSLMMKIDGKSAGVSYDAGGYADFHSWRTTFCTNTCHLTDQFTAAKLSRHSRVGTLTKHYDKQLIKHRHSVVSQLTAPAKS